VGLTEISVPSDVENVSNTVTTPSTSRIGFFRNITLDAKHYATIRDLVREMNAKQQMSVGEVDLFVEFFV